MSSQSPLIPKHLDRRVVDRYIRRGTLTDKEVQAHLKSLPDLDGHFEAITVGEPAQDDDDADSKDS